MNRPQQAPRFHILGIFPRCPFYQSATALAIILAPIALGTLGIYFLNVWAAVALLPFVLVFISFFRNFSIVALLALIGFALALMGNYVYMLRHKCRTCAIQQECHAAF